MDIEQIHNYATSLGSVEETQPFGPDNIVYKVNGKMFLLVATDEEPLKFNVKCNPDLAIELRERYEAVTAGYHMNKNIGIPLLLMELLQTNNLKSLLNIHIIW